MSFIETSAARQYRDTFREVCLEPGTRAPHPIAMKKSSYAKLSRPAGMFMCLSIPRETAAAQEPRVSRRKTRPDRPSFSLSFSLRFARSPFLFLFYPRSPLLRTFLLFLSPPALLPLPSIRSPYELSFAPRPIPIVFESASHGNGRWRL